ncbi:30S ribosomal protein 3 [Morus notabilis]|uniref:30S ribosomal protein 3 n=1 Tax=Morus notabilis TaxID=981085 RepID=W9SB90_9ROSA|nr:30S ribosomal protein 3, chloroplastic [Morus notabilis]EXB97159.1 30S ribosomal protein 3 [Morus notabilis]
MALQFQANWNASFKPSTWPSKTHFHIPKPIQTSLFAKPRTFSNMNSRSFSEFKPTPTATHSSRKFALSASAVAAEDTTVDDSTVEDTEKLGVVVKPVAKPRLILKFIWMEKNIGIGLDQVIPGHGTIPLSPYYFWPRKDAWEELKVLLESKPWISQKQMIILLNQATDIINLWQQSGGNLS